MTVAEAQVARVKVRWNGRVGGSLGGGDMVS